MAGVFGSRPGPDQRDGWTLEDAKLSAKPQDRRRICNLGERPRICRASVGERRVPQLRRLLEMPLGAVARIDEIVAQRAVTRLNPSREDRRRHETPLIDGVERLAVWCEEHAARARSPHQLRKDHSLEQIHVGRLSRSGPWQEARGCDRSQQSLAAFPEPDYSGGK